MEYARHLLHSGRVDDGIKFYEEFFRLCLEEIDGLKQNRSSVINGESNNKEKFGMDTIQKYEADITKRITVPEPFLSFQSIIGARKAKETLDDLVVLRFANQDLMNENELPLPSGILLYGPTGVAKSVLARAAAAESGASFIFLSGGYLKSGYYGQSEKMVEALFNVARRIEKCIIYIDEVDSIASNRLQKSNDIHPVLDQFLVESTKPLVAGEYQPVLIETTNVPHLMDEGALV